MIKVITWTIGETHISAHAARCLPLDRHCRHYWRGGPSLVNEQYRHSNVTVQYDQIIGGSDDFAHGSPQLKG